ncbi:hypothetical protein R1sor_012858 [Riccia sorocarpa]|uniref:OTU domain-containing protein n=1 Tax=Riccia sorocarpa TaxID=122646 RepID=A0ABD3I7Q1_9MARC
MCKRLKDSSLIHGVWRSGLLFGSSRIVEYRAGTRKKAVCSPILGGRIRSASERKTRLFQPLLFLYSMQTMTARFDDDLVRWGLNQLDGGGSLFPPSNGSGTDSQNYASNTPGQNLIDTEHISTTSDDYRYAGLDYMARPVRQSVTSDELIAHALQEELTSLAAAEEARFPRLSVTSDELIAHALQEELSSLAAAEEAVGSSGGSVVEGSKSTVLNQDWAGKGSSDRVDCSAGTTVRGTGEHGYGASGLSEAGVVEDTGLSSRFQTLVTEEESTMGPRAHASSSSSERRDRPRSPDYELYQHGDDDDLNLSLALALSEEVDEEVAKRLNKLDSIKHIPRVNTDFPTIDAASLDHQRLVERLVLYGLNERQIQGDGNCQFRALSDQLYRTSEYHKYVRKAIVSQLKSKPDVYSGYVPMSYNEYLKKMSKIVLRRHGLLLGSG